ncbi:hypothetical protein Nepgr_021626 [Nepenthes gracilis]|uniref:Uncharacterized protein n=1 Tax=Nepenthes gracilis TaxID=150966 RepID=A0AAD3XXD9_NEPGR|nr:hypothetical protein Nepgr_021626 [Nepenthes gracilis]
MEGQMCFDCLQHRIRSDFSDKIIFSHGIPDSALPFGTRAVVQVPNSSGEVSAEFLLVYLRSHENDCFTKYIDDHVVKDVKDFGIFDTVNTHGKGEEGSIINHNNSAPSAPVWSNSKCLLNSDRKQSQSGLHSEESTCTSSGWLSCFRMITAMAPCAHVGISSYSMLEEGKATSRAGKNFLSIVGIPSYNDVYIPGCLRHPNLAPILGMLKAPGYTCLIYPKTPFTLESILHYSPEALKSEWHIRFLIYQLLSALAYLHGIGVAHSNICPGNVLLTDSGWAWLSIWGNSQSNCELGAKTKDTMVSSLVGTSYCDEGCLSQNLYADLLLSLPVDWHTDFYKWWRGELSNFDYLLILNRLAGRRWGDHTFHTVMPWVIDFSVKPAENSDIGWRDLSKSKWRLAKGDEQLDFTYETSEVPHHVSDECLSELAVCSYKARRLPLSVLCMAVRSVYEPNEYPSTMQRLYQWTPDECIPEFYCDPQIFYSLHSGMSDLAVPSWAGSPEEFIKLHRSALESQHVSREIHHWIDITFGFKMSGHAALDAKNVMLPSSELTLPRSMGRRQLFTRPHPIRGGIIEKACHPTVNRTAISELHMDKVDDDKPLLPGIDYLYKLEGAASFCEHARHLSPLYCYDLDNIVNGSPPEEEPPRESSEGYQQVFVWRNRSSSSKNRSESAAKDIFALGCIIAELYLRRPLFDSISLPIYLNDGTLPVLVKELPPQVQFIVEACVQKDCTRRPSAKSLLESPYFPPTVKSSYLFLAPLLLLAKDESRLFYAANFTKKGALRAMGTFAAEMCATYCLPLLLNPLSDAAAECAYILLKEFLKCLKPKAAKTLVLNVIQKILQATGGSHLKVSLLQESFVREVWNYVGKHAYLERIHPCVISNLSISPHKSSAAAASVLLIGSSEELGIPVTVHQTILPLIYCFGKGLCNDGIDVLVRIGGVLGENFVVRLILPLLKNVVQSCIDASCMNKPEPIQSWNSLALVDCLTTLQGLIAYLSKEVVVKELIEDLTCLLVAVLLQKNLELQVLQAAASTLIAICQQIGANLTALHVLPQLKELFDELAFSRESARRPGSIGGSLKILKLKADEEAQIESRMGLVFLLYPSFAALLGIEKLRQCCATWLLLEQYLLWHHKWKWESTGESSRSSQENMNARNPVLHKNAASQYNPTKLLMNGVGWSIPQSQGNKAVKDLMLSKCFAETNENPAESHASISNIGKCEPWFWFPSPATNWDGPDFLGRAGGQKDDHAWKIRASVIYSVRAHHGALRSLAVGEDDCTVFTAGVGPGFKGTVQKWDLSSVDCVSGYYGHEEVVNDICPLSSSGRVASCDGTIHFWNSQTGKVISIIAESSVPWAHPTSSLSSALKVNSDPASVMNSNPLSSGILTGAFDGSLYTCMHFLESVEKLVVGTGNASLRFIDVTLGEKLHIWKSEAAEYGFPSLLSSICSCGSDKTQHGGHVSSPSWIAAGLSSGGCKLLDARSGNVVASWRAHDGYVTKLAAPDDHLLVSSSLDRTLRIWDLRKNLPPKPYVFKGHGDGISDFSVWGQDVISISRTRIGLSTLAATAGEDGQHHIVSQALYTADRGARNMHAFFSALFRVATLELAMYPVPDHGNTEAYLMHSTELNSHLTTMNFDHIETMNADGTPEFVLDPGLYYPAATNYGYYCTGIESPGEWDDQNRVFGIDGADIQYPGAQTESFPYLYYTPSYGFAESPYNPYNPYIPGAMIGFDVPYMGTQPYYIVPPYQNSSSPGYFLSAVQSRQDGMSTDPLLNTIPTVGNRGITSGARHKLSSTSATFSQNPTKQASNQSHPSIRTSESSRVNFGTSWRPLTDQSSASGSLSHVASSVVPQGANGSVSHQVTDNISHGKVLPQQRQLQLSLPVGGVLSDFAPSTNGRAVVDGSWSKFYPKKASNENGSPDMLGEQNRGPRINRSKNQFTVKAYTTKAGESNSQGNIIICADQYNKDGFPVDYAIAKFFVIKSYSEDDVHKSIKYNVWSSTPNGNMKLNSAYQDAQQIAAGKPGGCPIFLFFSVNASGQFCGVAEMVGAVDFLKDMDFWQQDKWSGSFPVKWHIIKDVPNTSFRHIILENNEHKPVTNSRDTQEIMYKKGMEMLKIFKNYMSKTSILDDFMYYEHRQRIMQNERAWLLPKANALPFEPSDKVGSLVYLPIKEDGKTTNNLTSSEKITESATEQISLSDVGDKSIAAAAVAKHNGMEVNDGGGSGSVSVHTITIGSLTINPKKIEHKCSGAAPSVGTVTVGSMPVQVNGFHGSSDHLTVGTIPLDPKALHPKKAGFLKKDALPK